MANIYLLVYCLPQLKYLYKSNCSKISGKNSIMLRFHESGSLSVLDKGRYICVGSISTYQVANCQKQLKEIWHTETTMPQWRVLGSFPLATEYWEASFIGSNAHQRHCHTRSSAENSILKVCFSANSSDCPWCWVGKQTSRGIQSQEVFRVRPHRQTWIKARILNASVIWGRTTAVHLFSPNWSLYKQNSFRWMSFSKPKPLQSFLCHRQWTQCLDQ